MFGLVGWVGVVGSGGGVVAMVVIVCLVVEKVRERQGQKLKRD